MEVNAKIELLVGLECIATKAMTTLKLSFNHLETIEYSSMLVLLQMELTFSTLFLGLLITLDLVRFDLIRFDLLFQYLKFGLLYSV